MLIEKERVKKQIYEHYNYEIENSILNGKLKKKKCGKKEVYKTSKAIWTPYGYPDFIGRVDGYGDSISKLVENITDKVINMLFNDKEKSVKEKKNITFAEVCQTWIDDYMPKRKNQSTKKLISKKTQQDYTIYSKKLIDSEHGKMVISKIKLDDINNYIYSNLNGFTKTPFKYTKTIISKTFSLAKKEGYISEIPFSDLKFDEFNSIAEPELKKEKQKNILRIEDFEYFAKASARLTGGIMVPVFLYTGMRPSELIRLQWQDVDFENSCINIARERTKTNSGERFIPIPEWINNELKEEYQNAINYENKNECKCLTVFHVKADYSKPYDENSLRAFWFDLLDEVDLAAGAIIYRNQIIYSNFDYSNSNIISENDSLTTYHIIKSSKNKKRFDELYPQVASNFKSKMIPYVVPDSMRHTFKSYGSANLPDAHMRKVFGHTTQSADDNYEHIVKEELKKSMEILQEKFDNLFGKIYNSEKSKCNNYFNGFFEIFKNENKEFKNAMLKIISKKALYFICNGREYTIRINQIKEFDNKTTISTTLFAGFDTFRKSSIGKYKTEILNNETNLKAFNHNVA